MKFMMEWGWSCIIIEPLEIFAHVYYIFNGSTLSGVLPHMIIIYSTIIHNVKLEHIALNNSKNLVDKESIIIKRCLTRERKNCHIAIVLRVNQVLMTKNNVNGSSKRKKNGGW